MQEIKTAKLQHKLLSKSVVELQRNASAQYAELGADLASLAARLARLPAEAHLTEEQLAVRVDALVRAHLLHVSGQMMSLQAALASSGAARIACWLLMCANPVHACATPGTHSSAPLDRVFYLSTQPPGLRLPPLSLQPSSSTRCCASLL